MKNHKKRFAALASLALVASIGLSACGSDDDGGNGGGDGGDGGGNASITFLPKNLGNPYFDASTVGGEARPRSSAAASRRSARPGDA